MENKDPLDLIAQYLHGDLSPEEMQRFESLRAADADFAEEVEMAEVVFTDAKVRKKAEWQKWIDEEAVGNPGGQPAPLPRFPIPVWATTVMLVVAIGLVLWIFGNKPTLQEQAGDYLLTLECPFSQTMGAKPSQDKLWSDAVGDCQNTDYGKALLTLTYQIESGTATPRTMLLAAYCSLRIGDFQMANVFSKQLIQTTGHRHAETAHWYLAIGQILNREEALARTSLEKIASEKMKDWQKATGWLEVMEEL